MGVCESCEYKDNPIGHCCERKGELLEKDNKCERNILGEMRSWQNIKLYTHEQEDYFKPLSYGNGKIKLPEELLKKAKKDLSSKQYEVLDKVITNNRRAVELAEAWGVSEPAISKLKKKVKKYLEQALKGG